MFRNRKNDQKPDDELLNKFKKKFTDAMGRTPNHFPPGYDTVNPAAVESAVQDQPGSDDELKMNEPTLRAMQDCRLAPSLMDPSSFSYLNTATQPPGYHKPNSGDMATIYHYPAGDLPTPLPYNLVTQLSLANVISGALPSSDPNPADINMQEFQNQFFPHQFQSIDPFAQQSYAPNQFINHDANYDPLDRSAGNHMDAIHMQINDSIGVVSANTGLSAQMNVTSSLTGGEKFRYHVTLRAPTAMVKQPEEIPVTYLNKGQAYLISVMDTTPPSVNSPHLKYRTFIRVSFEDEQQRAKPAACWQLWKEGRGSNEAHQRDGKLLAVEYVDPSQVGGNDDHRHPQIELESASFDGFCVTWTPNPHTGASNCTVSVRFNFLSTDFSHSKGVKGIPVRLCAKTQAISPDNEKIVSTTPEVCYCKVKLFRDHGAERKLSNDVAHVKKTMEKLKQQITQLEMGSGNFGKRKRSQGSVAAKSADNRSSKVTKHKRTWSVSSNEGVGKLSPEEDLHLKLAMMQDMFSSTRPVSVFNLTGEDFDDPDLFPVALPGEWRMKFEPFSCQNPVESFRSRDAASNFLSPSNSSVSLDSPRRASEHSLSSNKEEAMDWAGSSDSHSSVWSQPVKVQRLPRGSGTISTGYIEAIDVDPTYRPPAERPPKPIACFYVRFQSKPYDDYYRAVYLSERTVRDFLEKISEKHSIDPDRITRILRINSNGLEIMVDDNVVKQLPDGQDMVIEFAEATSSESTTPDVNTPSSAVEVKLTF